MHRNKHVCWDWVDSQGLTSKNTVTAARTLSRNLLVAALVSQSMRQLKAIPKKLGILLLMTRTPSMAWKLVLITLTRTPAAKHAI